MAEHIYSPETQMQYQAAMQGAPPASIHSASPSLGSCLRSFGGPQVPLLSPRMSSQRRESYQQSFSPSQVPLPPPMMPMSSPRRGNYQQCFSGSQVPMMPMSSPRRENYQTRGPRDTAPMKPVFIPSSSESPRVLQRITGHVAVPLPQAVYYPVVVPVYVPAPPMEMHVYLHESGSKRHHSSSSLLLSSHAKDEDKPKKISKWFKPSK